MVQEFSGIVARCADGSILVLGVCVSYTQRVVHSSADRKAWTRRLISRGHVFVFLGVLIRPSIVLFVRSRCKGGGGDIARIRA